jgi:hypothetical protein
MVFLRKKRTLEWVFRHFFHFLQTFQMKKQFALPATARISLPQESETNQNALFNVPFCGDNFLLRKDKSTHSMHVYYFYVKNTKAEYFMNTFNECENIPKEMWKVVNKLTNKCSKTTVISEIHQGDQVITNKSEIANALNTYFSEVGQKLANEIPNSGRTPESYLTYTSTEFSI